MFTFGWSWAVAERKGPRECRWKSSVKTCPPVPVTIRLSFHEKRAPYLDYNFHQVLLRNDVLAIDDLFQNTGEDSLLVHIQIDAVELTEPDEVGPDKDAQIAPLVLALFAFPRVALVL